MEEEEEEKEDIGNQFVSCGDDGMVVIWNGGEMSFFSKSFSHSSFNPQQMM